MKRIKFFASILLMLCLSVVCCAQTKIDWKQIKNIPDTLEFKNVLLEHLLFKSAYQPVMESIHQGAIYYDNMLERLRVYEHGQWRDLSVTIASDSIGAPLTILGYLQASDIYASQSAHINGNIYASSSMYLKNNIYASGSAYLKNNIYASGSAYLAGGVNASGTSTLDRLKVNTSLKVPLTTDTTLGAGSIAYDTATGKLKVLNSSNTWDNVGTDIAVDSAMSSTSTNPVQNKVINSFLTDGTGSLNVKNIKATDATATSKLYAYDFVATHTLVLPPYYVDGDIHSLYGNTAALSFDNSDKKAKYVFAPVGGGTGYKILSTEDNTVSDVATSTVNGTITVTKDGVSTNVAVKGLGSAAYANVASFTPQSSSTAPSNPSVGQIYFDSTLNNLRYWDGSLWVNITNEPVYVVTHMLNTDVYESGSVQRSAEVLWKKTRRHPYGSEEPQYFETFGEILAKVGHSYAIIELNHKLDTAYEYSFNVTLSNCDICAISKANDPITLSNLGYQVPSDKTVFVVRFGIYQSMNNAMVPYTNGGYANFCIKGFVLDENN